GALDTTSQASTYQVSTRVQIQKLMDSHQLYDCWRVLHPAERDYSYYSFSSCSYSRIDLFLLPHRFLNLVHSCKYDAITWSDHAPISLSIQIPSLHPTRTQWKLNDTLLNHTNIRNQAESSLGQYFELNTHPVSTYPIIWEAHKSTIR
ncbi:Hypothetical predicted protein, partial [Pelobates cultripes]